MGTIFISYRQDDTMAVSEQIYTKLCERFGRDTIYKDKHVIPKGVRYDEHIDQHIPDAPVFLELIGSMWVSATDPQGNQRLHQPDDLLRGEINTALRLHIPMIPVFIDTQRPADGLVPEDVRPLLMYNGVSINSQTFDADMAALIAAIELYVREDEYRYREHDGVRALLPPLIHIPKGAFVMGNDAEKPANSVDLNEYSIALFPVTVEEYQLFINATGHPVPGSIGGVYWATQTKHDRLHHPVVNVSWYDAIAYAGWLNKITGQTWRLPSEAEWEKAARWDAEKQRSRIYPWGDTWDIKRANTAESNIHTTTRVKAYPYGKSSYGVFDMVGNVWEWTASISKPYSYDAHVRSADSKAEGQRVRRGGSFLEDSSFATTTKRLADNPAICKPNVGFRLALN